MGIVSVLGIDEVSKPQITASAPISYSGGMYMGGNASDSQASSGVVFSPRHLNWVERANKRPVVVTRTRLY